MVWWDGGNLWAKHIIEIQHSFAESILYFSSCINGHCWHFLRSACSCLDTGYAPQQIDLPQAQDIEPALHGTFFPDKTKLILKQDEKNFYDLKHAMSAIDFITEDCINSDTLKIQPAPNSSLQPDFKAASLKTKIVTSPKTRLLALIWS